MTNFEIIVRTAIASKIYTEAEAGKIILERGELPLHTFAEWKSRGYKVKKGEHAKLTTFIWKHKSEKVEAKTASGEDTEVESNSFYKVKAFLFGDEQVEAIKA